jgi:plasmid stability protein
MTQVREQNIVSAAVDAETRVELKRRAAAADRTVSAEVRRALRRYLGDDDQEPNEEGKAHD